MKPFLKDYKFKHILKVGAELEGGWADRPSFQIADDASVHCRGSVLGEYRTIPADSVKGLLDEIRGKYPDDIDDTCGLHIHTSLEPLKIAYLGSGEFFKYFMMRMGVVGKYLRETGHTTDYKRFLERFSGRNRYCQKIFEPSSQLGGKTDRRTMINFCSYSSKKTVECRLLPMFEMRNNAEMAAFEYVDTIETFLNKYKEPKIYKLSIECPDESNEIIGEELCV